MPKASVAALLLLLAAVVGLQAALEGQPPPVLPAGETGNILYVRSGELAKRIALSYRALAADVYWIRTVQHYGSTKLSKSETKTYDLLYPLLDLTTSLDPHFNIAYRFGAIFLAEKHPSGAGSPDLAIALLKKGLMAQPNTWEFAQDIGFVHYWWLHDYPTAAEWFKRAGNMHGAPNWLPPLAAVTLAQGGNRASSRRLWQEVLKGADAEWLRTQAVFRLRQLDAMDHIEALEALVRRYRQRTGALPQSWVDLVRAGDLQGIPLDPANYPYQLDPLSGAIGLDPTSSLNPLPAPERPRA